MQKNHAKQNLYLLITILVLNSLLACIHQKSRLGIDTSQSNSQISIEIPVMHIDKRLLTASQEGAEELFAMKTLEEIDRKIVENKIAAQKRASQVNRSVNSSPYTRVIKWCRNPYIVASVAASVAAIGYFSYLGYNYFFNLSSTESSLPSFEQIEDLMRNNQVNGTLLNQWISKGLNPNLSNNKGTTLCMTSAYYGDDNVFTLLKTHGASCSESNQEGYTAKLIALCRSNCMTTIENWTGMSGLRQYCGEGCPSHCSGAGYINGKLAKMLGKLLGDPLFAKKINGTIKIQTMKDLELFKDILQLEKDPDGRFVSITNNLEPCVITHSLF